jgi:hypothetical protein
MRRDKAVAKPHVARGNNAQVRDKITYCRGNTTTGLRIEKQAAAIKHPKKRIHI